MFERIEKKIRNELLMKLFNEQLFCNMFITLKNIGEEYADLSPVEVWQEARLNLSCFIDSARPDFSIHILKEELTERYRVFSDNEKEIDRKQEDADSTVFIVLMTMMYILVSSSATNEENPYKLHCRALADATKDHPLLVRLWQGIRDVEDEEEQLGRKVGVVNYLIDTNNKSTEEQQQIMAEVVNSALKCSTDTIEKQITVISMVNRNHNGLFNEHLKALEEGLEDKSKGRSVKEFHVHKAVFNDATFGCMYDVHDNENVHTR